MYQREGQGPQRKEAAMSYSISLYLAAATAGLNKADQACLQGDPDLDDALAPALQRIGDLVERFRQGPVTPLATAAFEKDLQEATRQLARVTTEWTYNHLEPSDVATLPQE